MSKTLKTQKMKNKLSEYLYYPQKASGAFVIDQNDLSRGSIFIPQNEIDTFIIALLEIKRRCEEHEAYIDAKSDQIVETAHEVEAEAHGGSDE